MWKKIKSFLLFLIMVVLLLGIFGAGYYLGTNNGLSGSLDQKRKELCGSVYDTCMKGLH